MQIKIKDIAKKTGVSTATVSRVLNESAQVSEDTAKKIQKVLGELDYYSNFTARNLRRGITTTIGFVVSNIANSFFAKAAFAIETELRKKANYDLIISNTEYSKDLEIRSLKVLISQKVRGIILAPVSSNNELINKIIKVLKIPLVLVDNNLQNIQAPAVLQEDLGGVYRLTSHLMSHGHKKIAFLGGKLTETSGLRRLEGYKKALIDNKIPVRDHFIKIGEWDIEAGFKMTKQLLRLNKKPTAMVSADTHIGIGCLLALRQKKIKVPEDIALVSFDDLEFCSVLSPPLTTLAEVAPKVGKTAAHLLLKMIRTGNFESKEILIKSEIVPRKSCGCKT